MASEFPQEPNQEPFPERQEPNASRFPVLQVWKEKYEIIQTGLHTMQFDKTWFPCRTIFERIAAIDWVQDLFDSYCTLLYIFSLLRL